MSRPFLLSVLLLALSISSLGAPAGFAFVPAAPNLPSRWNKRVIPISISTSLNEQGAIPDGDVEGAIRSALDAWEKVSGITFEVSWSGSESVSSSAARSDRRNLITIAPNPENLLMFSGDASEDAARTRVFTDRRGFITEADIVLNPYQQFSTDGTFGTFDLQAVVTHELGHLLGLSHSPVIGATMSEYIAKNGTFGVNAFSPRALSSDDIVGVRGLYAGESEECCGSVAGRLDRTVAGARQAVWLEDETTGRVVAGRFADASGLFRIDGLEEGTYVLRVDTSSSGIRRSTALQAEENVVVSKGETTLLRPSLRSVMRSFSSPVNGSGGQFAPVAVSVSVGGRRGILLGTGGRFSGGLKISSTSALVAVVESQIYGGENGSGLSVMGIELALGEDVPAGEYTLVMSDGDGTRSFLIGGIKVQSYERAKSPF